MPARKPMGQAAGETEALTNQRGVSNETTSCLPEERDVVRADDMLKPEINQAEDTIFRIANTTMCGSDVHLHRGTSARKSGEMFAHEVVSHT
jgi:threonine dehydrogenase-like Zn-dependent dehydrogenase